MRLHVWTDFTTAGSSNFDCNNARCLHPLCWPCQLGMLRFQLHFTCSATLFLSFEVRACCDSAVDFTGKKVVSIVVIFKIKVVGDFYVTKQRISISKVFSVDFSGTRGGAPSAARVRLLASPRVIKLSLRACRSNSSVLPLHADLPWKSPCCLQDLCSS